MAKPAKSSSSTGRSACQDRSERTRQRLIEVATEVFAELGFEAASTRIIVERAQANLVSIPYYFGSKLGLYEAAAEYIGSSLAERFRPVGEHARQRLLQQGLTHEQTLHDFTEFIVEFAEIMLGADTPNSWGQFIIREQFDPSSAFEILHTHFLPLLEVGFDYVSRLTGCPAEAPETRLRFMAILAMVKFTRVDRATLLRNTGWKAVGKSEIGIVTAVLRQYMQALFAAPPA
jgi:TetR/AcrR family transcriptional regulator, regulator of cefoperazone and chloramphenicol sensitivity